MKDLGVLLNSDLSYSKHVDMIRPKAFKLPGLIRRNCLRQFSKSSNRLLYIAFVRPQIEYASVVWNPYHTTKIDAIEKIQQRFIHQQCFRSNIEYHRTDYYNHCKTNRFQALSKRRLITVIVLLYKIINNYIDSWTFNEATPCDVTLTCHDASPFQVQSNI